LSIRHKGDAISDYAYNNKIYMSTKTFALAKTLPGDTFHVGKKFPKVSSIVILQRKYLIGMTFEKFSKPVIGDGAC